MHPSSSPPPGPSHCPLRFFTSSTPPPPHPSHFALRLFNPLIPPRVPLLYIINFPPRAGPPRPCCPSTIPGNEALIVYWFMFTGDPKSISYILIHYVCQLVNDGRAGHGLGTGWTRTEHGRDWAWTGHEHGQAGHGSSGLGTTRANWARADWARTGWAQADCVQMSRVPTRLTNKRSELIYNIHGLIRGQGGPTRSPW
jgi:hypothetical protein